jgi:hypothetical protein
VAETERGLVGRLISWHWRAWIEPASLSGGHGFSRLNNISSGEADLCASLDRETVASNIHDPGNWYQRFHFWSVLCGVWPRYSVAEKVSSTIEYDQIKYLFRISRKAEDKRKEREERHLARIFLHSA